jgi:DNA-binding transcriptional regulator GbsR (MarR family)
MKKIEDYEEENKEIIKTLNNWEDTRKWNKEYLEFVEKNDSKIIVADKERR